MKVLLINSVCGIRSTGRICTDIAKELENRGHEVRIAYGREQVPEQYKNIAVRIGTDFDVKCNALKCRIFDNDGFSAKKQTEKFLNWAQKYDPDMLWLHNLHGYYINVEMLFNWIKSRPQMKVKWTLHDCWAFTGHCSHFTFANCKRWEEGCFNCPQKKNYPSSILADMSKQNWIKKKELFTSVKNMTVITPSIWLSELVKQSFLGEYNIEVINNKIDLTVFRPRESNFKKSRNLENKKLVLGVASAWGERKGLSDFIKLSNMLDDTYKIILIGLTKKQLDLIPDSIIGIERTNDAKELAEIYTAADVFVNLTYSDNYPTVNLEAKACGTKIITYNTGGSPESAGEKAIVVPTGDINSVFEAIKQVCR